jgi:prevent-host-death family protein
MPTVIIHKAKTNLSRLIEKAAQGEEIIIARGSKPVAKLVPLGEVKSQRPPGALRGKLSVGNRSSSRSLRAKWPAGNKLLLPGPHKNPFDGMLIAQSHAENLPLISNERVFPSYGVRCLW